MVSHQPGSLLPAAPPAWAHQMKERRSSHCLPWSRASCSETVKSATEKLGWEGLVFGLPVNPSVTRRQPSGGREGLSCIFCLSGSLELLPRLRHQHLQLSSGLLRSHTNSSAGSASTSSSPWCGCSCLLNVKQSFIEKAKCQKRFQHVIFYENSQGFTGMPRSLSWGISTDDSPGYQRCRVSSPQN